MNSSQQIGHSQLVDEDSPNYQSSLFRDILDRSASYIFLIDRSLQIVYATPKAAKRMGLTSDKIIGMTFEELGLDSETIRDFTERLNQVLDKGITQEGEASICLPDGEKLFQYSAVPQRDGNGRVEGVVVTAENITTARTVDMLNEALNRINAAINSTLSFEEIMKRIVVESSKTIRSGATALALREGDSWILKHVYGAIPQRALGQRMSEEEMRACFLSPNSCPVSVSDCDSEDWVNASAMIRYRIKSFLSIPLKARGEVVGVLIFSYPRPKVYSKEEMDFAEKLSASVSMSLENSQLYHYEREQRFLMQTILDNIPAVIIALDGRDLRIIWANHASEKYKPEGLRNKDFKEMRLQDIVPNAEETQLAGLLKSVAMSGRPSYDQEFALPGLGPDMVYWRGALVPTKNAERDIPDLLILAVDITDQVKARKESESMARKSEEEKNQLNTLLDTLPVGVVITDRSGRVIQMNGVAKPFWDSIIPSFEVFHDLEKVQAWFTSTGDHLKVDDWGAVRAIFGGESISNDLVTIRRYDGHLVTILTSAAPIRDAEGRVIGAAQVFQDITKLLHLEHEVVEAKARAEQYLEVLTHDIGNLNGPVVGYLQLLQDQSNLSEKEKEWIKRSLQSLDESTRLVENIRTIQMMECKTEIVDIDKMLEKTVKEYSNHPNRDVTIMLNATGQHCTVGNDLLSEVFSNIVDNSIKHSSGQLHVNIRISGAFELGTEHHKIEFEDDGPGIPDEMKDRVFSRKERGRAKAVGMGLGLFLVKRLVEDINGRVWVEDRIQGDHTKGAKFVVLLPAVPCDLIGKGT